jgi:hypothetical protein
MVATIRPPQWRPYFFLAHAQNFYSFPGLIFTKIFMHFSTTSPAFFGRIRLLDCAGPIDTDCRSSSLQLHLPHFTVGRACALVAELRLPSACANPVAHRFRQPRHKSCTADTGFEAEADQKVVSKRCHDTGDTPSNKSGNGSDPVVPDGAEGAAKVAWELMERLKKGKPPSAA